MIDKSKEIRELFTLFIKQSPNINLVEEEIEWPDFDKFEFVHKDHFTDVAWEGIQNQLVEEVSLRLFYELDIFSNYSINIKVEPSFKYEMYLVSFSKQIQP